MSQMAVAQARSRCKALRHKPVEFCSGNAISAARRKPPLQRSASGPAPETVPPIVHEVLRSPGAALIQPHVLSWSPLRS